MVALEAIAERRFSVRVRDRTERRASFSGLGGIGGAEISELLEI